MVPDRGRCDSRCRLLHVLLQLSFTSSGRNWMRSLKIDESSNSTTCQQRNYFTTPVLQVLPWHCAGTPFSGNTSQVEPVSSSGTSVPASRSLRPSSTPIPIPSSCPSAPPPCYEFSTFNLPTATAASSTPPPSVASPTPAAPSLPAAAIAVPPSANAAGRAAAILPLFSLRRSCAASTSGHHARQQSRAGSCDSRREDGLLAASAHACQPHESL
jgi:hypothetical protein